MKRCETCANSGACKIEEMVKNQCTAMWEKFYCAWHKECPPEPVEFEAVVCRDKDSRVPWIDLPASTEHLRGQRVRVRMEQL